MIRRLAPLALAASLCAPAARAQDCGVLAHLNNIGVPDAVIVSLIEDAPAPYTPEALACLTASGLSASALMAAHERSSGGRIEGGGRAGLRGLLDRQVERLADRQDPCRVALERCPAADLHRAAAALLRLALARESAAVRAAYIDAAARCLEALGERDLADNAYAQAAALRAPQSEERRR